VQFISGGSRQGITSQITGGELGGLIRYREEVLDSTMNSLGRLALSVSDQVNAQLGQGLDLKGQVGSALFGNYNDPALAKLRVNAFVGNSNAQPLMNITDTSVLTTSDYLMEYDGSSYKVRRLSDNQLMTVAENPVGTLSFTDKNGRDQGFQVVLGNPAPTAGDKFSLQPTRRGASDIKATLDQADQLAFAAPVRAQSTLQNSGTGAIGQPNLLSAPSPIDPAALAAAFEGLTLTTGTAPNEQQYSFEFTLSGRPAAGDTFTFNYNQSGVSDNRNALKLVDLQSKQTVGVTAGIAGSGFSFTDGYGELVERVGTLTAQARMDSEATGAILKQATDNRDSLSAVNLDEEAANLIKFEQYYNASAQIIQVARSLFDTLISTFR